jgi:hypothetical protein
MEIDRAYVTIALAFAVIGMMLGLYMGITSDFKLQSVHVAFLLPGFVFILAGALLLWQFWTYAR